LWQVVGPRDDAQLKTLHEPPVSVEGKHCPFQEQPPVLQRHFPDLHLVLPRELLQDVTEQVPPVSAMHCAGDEGKQMPSLAHQPGAHLHEPLTHCVAPRDSAQLKTLQVPEVSRSQELLPSVAMCFVLPHSTSGGQCTPPPTSIRKAGPRKM
jgi:hypothetical protein